MAGRSPFDRSDNFQTIRDEEAEFAPTKKHQRRCCCCLPIWLCFALILFLIAGLAAALFFLWPRIPAVNYMSSDLDTSQGTQNFQLNDQKLSTHIKSTLELNNPNYIPLYLKNVTLQLSLPSSGDSSGDSIDVGYGYLVDPINFPPKTTTNFTIDSNIILDLKSQDTKNVNALANLVKACKDKTKVKINYFAKADVPLISWTGYQPSFSGLFGLDCPFNLNNLT